MASCIIHIDGSFYPHTSEKSHAALGWGILAEHDDQTHEACGGHRVRRNQGLNGAHEDVALLYALQYMRERGFPPQKTSIYCDDELMGHAPTYLAKENFRAHMTEQVERRVKRAAQFIGHDTLVPQIMEELHSVRMHKVKGHQGHVYQERVNYLAKWSAHQAVGESTTQLPFEDWLKKGLVIYMSPEPDLVALGLTDPLPDALGTQPEKPTAKSLCKPRVRIEHAPFVHNLLSLQEISQETPAP